MPGAATNLAAAIRAFLESAPLPGGFIQASAGSYVALYGVDDPPATEETTSTGPLLLRGSDGSVFVPDTVPVISLLDSTLRACQLRPGGTTLALRLPPLHGDAAAAQPDGAASGGAVGPIMTCRQWNSIKELAAMRAGGAEAGVWK